MPAQPRGEQSAREERRLVTALFCDLVGFTPLSEQLDPEEVRDIQSAYFAAMREQIERYGGTVQKYAGDAVLAFFGAPIVREDDAERAVLCALEMQRAIQSIAEDVRERYQVDPAIRVGVNTGEVVSGIWEVGDRLDLDITGDAVNTAARFQAVAEPGEVLVGLETMNLTQRRIEYGEQRDLALKGKEGTVPAFPALRVRDEMGERWEARATPLVGREREMTQLLELWRRAEHGHGQLIMLSGDPGVGKSRLISEFGSTIGGSAAQAARGRCLSYGQEISLWLIADVLRNLFGIRENDPTERVRERLTERIGSLLGGQDAETRDIARDVLGAVLGLPPGGSTVAQADAQVRRRFTIRSLRLVLATLSERAPTVLVLEDLHWMDAASAEVLTEILADVPGLRLLVLAAHRPGWTAPWSEWGWPESLRLRPLEEEDATVLAQAVLGGKPLSSELEHYVADRAGGNPFFVEEMLRALQEAGDVVDQDGQMQLVPGAAERLPSTLTEVLLARLDRLETEVRSLAQVASVIGRSFAVRLLAGVTGQDEVALELPLASLQRAEIAFPRQGPDLEYVFKHVSMREVAYNTLVQKRRQALHAATAKAIATLYPSDEYVEMIAYHYARTEEHGEAAQWLERAGDRAASVYANEGAVAQYREARRRFQRAGAGDTTLARVDEKLAAILMRSGRYDEALKVLERAVEVHRQVQDLESTARVTAQIGRVHRHRGTIEEGIARVDPVLETLAWSGPSQGLASLYAALSLLLFAGGRYADSMSAAERAAELGRAVGDDRILAEAKVGIGTAMGLLGEHESAVQVLEEAIPLAEVAGDFFSMWRALNNAGEEYRDLGQLERSRSYIERALEACERVADLGALCYLQGSLGELLFYLGDWDGAHTRVDRAAAVVSSIGSSWFAAYPPLYLGRLYLAEGDWECGARSLETSVAIARQSHDLQALQWAEGELAELDLLKGRPEASLARLEPLFAEPDTERALLLPTLASTHLELGDVEQAEREAAEAVQSGRDQHMGFRLARALRVEGTILTRQERWEEAERSLLEAISLARSMPYPYAEAFALRELGTMYLRKGDEEPSRQHLDEALSIFRRLGAKKEIERTQQVLAGLNRPADLAR